MCPIDLRIWRIRQPGTETQPAHADSLHNLFSVQNTLGGFERNGDAVRRSALFVFEGLRVGDFLRDSEEIKNTVHSLLLVLRVIHFEVD